jgi:hypothetical protein
MPILKPTLISNTDSRFFQVGSDEDHTLCVNVYGTENLNLGEPMKWSYSIFEYKGEEDEGTTLHQEEGFKSKDEAFAKARDALVDSGNTFPS